MAVDIGKVGGRAATGATVGSAFGPTGTLIGGAAGGLEGLLEGLFSPSSQDATNAAGAEKLRKMDQAYQILEAQRGRQAQTGMNQLANRMGAYQGANNVLASMYGPRGSMAPNINTTSGGPRMAGQPMPPAGLSHPPPQYAPPGANTAPPVSYGGGAAQPPGNNQFAPPPRPAPPPQYAPPSPQLAPPPALPAIPGAQNYNFGPKPLTPNINSIAQLFARPTPGMLPPVGRGLV